MFPVTLELAKRNLQVPAESTDQDQVILDHIEDARAILSNYISRTTVNNPPPESRINVRRAGLMVVRELYNDGGEHLFNPRVGFDPAWQLVLANEYSSYSVDEEEVEEMSTYEEIDSVVEVGPGLRKVSDPDAMKITIVPTRAASFLRRIGWHGDASVTPVIISVSGNSSTSGQIVVPPNTGQGHIWIWMADAAAPLDRVLVPGLGDARSQFGNPKAITVEDILGTLWVTTGPQRGSDWAGKTITLE